MTPSRVALVRCSDYDPAGVDEAVRRAVELLGGATAIVRPGESILLKPNLLVAAPPEGLVTGHPTVFRAVARLLQEAGAVLSYGDSPGIGRAPGVARKSGVAAAAAALGIPLADFSESRCVSFTEGRLVKQFTVACAALDVDGIVSLPKLKTHGMQRITGAVKNQFGCVPGLLKGEFHARMDTMERFAQMLVDLTRLLRPRLYVMDGIVAMQGNGPRSGDPRRLEALLVSTDPVALDATVCRMIAVDPAMVPTIVWGDEWGLGQAYAVEVVGDPLSSFVDPGFVVDRRPGSTTGAHGGWARVVRDRMVPRPVIDPLRCTACGTCVKVCPVVPKAVSFGPGDDPTDAADKPVSEPSAGGDAQPGSGPAAGGRAPSSRTDEAGVVPPRARLHPRPPRHDYSRCIRCYCCQEMCPERAIGIERPLLGRLIHR